MEYKYVCSASNVHVLLLFFLLNRDATLDNTVFIFPRDGGIRYESWKNVGSVYWFVRKKGLWQRILNYYRTACIFHKRKLGRAARFGMDEGGWTEYLIHTTNHFNLIEDGWANYILSHSNWEKYKHSMIRKLLLHTPFVHIPYGQSGHVSTVYMTGLSAIPQEIRHKVKLVNMKKLWEQCTPQRKQAVFDFFGVTKADREEEGRPVLILTQPLSEDGFMPESDKIDIYKNVIRQYGESNILIKPHPREKTNYRSVFPRCAVLNFFFPVELLALSGGSIKTVVTVFSTAIGAFENCNKIMLGKDVHPGLASLELPGNPAADTPADVLSGH